MSGTEERWIPSGSTHVAAVMGDPIAHSLSPLIHNTGFRVLGLDWVFVAFRVQVGGGRRALDAMRSFGLSGMSVTMPLKTEVMAGLDHVSPVAQRLGAVNAIVRHGDVLNGDNTDGQGFVAALREMHSFEPSSKRCVVVGSGGAARAVTLALAQAGASDVAVVARRVDHGSVAADLAGVVGRVGVVEDISNADLVVNATPVGMGDAASGTAATPFDASLVGAGQFVCDLIYHPTETSLMTLARSNGASVANGLGMLIYQAGLAFSWWTGEKPPIEAMLGAVKEAQL